MSERDLDSLIATLKSLNGPCREADAEIWRALEFPVSDDEIGDSWKSMVSPLTASIDIAMQLVVRHCEREWYSVLRSGLSEMSQDFGYHCNFPRGRDVDLVPKYVLVALLEWVKRNDET